MIGGFGTGIGGAGICGFECAGPAGAGFSGDGFLDEGAEAWLLVDAAPPSSGAGPCVGLTAGAVNFAASGAIGVVSLAGGVGTDALAAVR
tara:strand:- start:17 stop:286 length:270 start_codon:yes stop_codon:yes gene_type:complete